MVNMMPARAENTWKVTYPEDCIKYIEAFRRHYWDHQGTCKLLDEFFSQQGNVQSVCELGSGAGTNLMYLDDYGYQCFGYDSNQESILLSQKRAESNEKNIEFNLLDFSKNLPNCQFDAVVSLFVPISLEDMEKLAQSCSQILKPGGYFACMLLAVLPEFEAIPEHNVTNTEFLEVDGTSVIRFNYYKKYGHQIQYDGVYFAGEPTGPRMFQDRDRYDLLTQEQMLKIADRGYRHIKRTKVQGKPDQCPPMTYEVIDFFQKN